MDFVYNHMQPHSCEHSAVSMSDVHASSLLKRIYGIEDVQDSHGFQDAQDVTDSKGDDKGEAIAIASPSEGGGESHPRAYVVFSGKTDIRFLKILKRGFRHCFILLNDGEHWISLDLMANYIDVLVHQVPADFDFPQWLSKRGHVVVPSRITRHEKPAPLAFLTCVEAVKRVLGIHKRFIFTPWQLFKHLTQGAQDSASASIKE